MLFSALNKDIPISQLVIDDNLASYHNIISFVSPTKLPVKDGVLKTPLHNYDVHIINQDCTNGSVKVDCITKAVEKSFCSNTVGYNGFTTIDKLFVKLGFAYYSDYKSNNTYLSIPQCPVTTLFDMMTKYASFANGGGAHFYMSQDGTVHGFDYKLIKERGKPLSLYGSIISEKESTNWTLYTPSEYELLEWDENNNFKRETLTLEKGFGKSTVRITDTTGVWKDVEKQALTNTFYNKWYNGHTVVISTARGAVPIVGMLINLNGNGDTFIVKAVSIAYDELQEVPTTTVTLISNPKFND